MVGGDHVGMPGMMAVAEMERLSTARGDRFAEMWMKMMVQHHEGALAMIEEVRADGEHEGLRSLAEQMRAAQSAEIEDLERWLAGG